MPKIFVTRNIPGTALEKLKEGNELVISNFDRVLTSQEIIDNAKDADAILSLLTDKITAELLDSLPTIKVVSNYAVGFDNVDVKAATERGIVVTNTPSDEVNEAVAEFAWSTMMALSRRVVEADEYGRKGSYHGWEPEMFLGRDIYGKTLGIVGLGRIGSNMARRAAGFKMKVLYYERDRNEEREKELGIEYADLNTLMANSDYVSLHVPLTDETRHMINAQNLALMKPTAFLVNTARGPVVEEHSLARALREGKLAGAALDVHENEPQMNPEMMQMENTILTPHIASATVEVREKMTQQAVDNILKVLSGEKPESFVNPEVWEKRRS